MHTISKESSTIQETSDNLNVELNTCITKQICLTHLGLHWMERRARVKARFRHNSSVELMSLWKSLCENKEEQAHYPHYIFNQKSSLCASLILPHTEFTGSQTRSSSHCSLVTFYKDCTRWMYSPQCECEAQSPGPIKGGLNNYRLLTSKAVPLTVWSSFYKKSNIKRITK